MTDPRDAIRALQAERDALVARLNGIDKALAALQQAVDAPAAPPAGHVSDEPSRAPEEVRPTRLDPARRLSDEHKFALKEGRRRASHLKEAAAGRAREPRDPARGLAPAASTGTEPPRLVKRPSKPAGR